MDIVAHTLWIGAGTVLAARHFPITRRTVVVTMTLAALPDVLQFVPVLAWVLFADGSWTALRDHAGAAPGREPTMPAGIALAAHHLHCITHSAIIAGVASGLIWLWRRSLRIPLLGWWSHIVIDVFTHSTDFFPVPVLYPISYRGFNGIAWNEPWFMALNYAALAGLWLWLLGRRSR
jgi:hypothetical protein